MGMAVMLDEIINYVQSLQNQVEVIKRSKVKKKRRRYTDIVHFLLGKGTFNMALILIPSQVWLLLQFLSLKLTAPSTFYDFNSEIDALETMQVSTCKIFMVSFKGKKKLYAGLNGCSFRCVVIN